MLPANVISQLDNSRRELKEELKTHKNSGECTDKEDCGKCKAINDRISEINSIANEGWAPF